MPALAAGQIKKRLLLVTGRNHQPFRSTKTRPLHARHVGVAVHEFRRHVEPARQFGHPQTQGMPHLQRVDPPPGCFGRRQVFGAQLRELIVHRTRQQRIKTRESRVEQMRGPLVEERPRGIFVARAHAGSKAGQTLVHWFKKQVERPAARNHAPDGSPAIPGRRGRPNGRPARGLRASRRWSPRPGRAR